MARREDVDRTRFGIWGANVGAYAAVVAAAADSRVRAIAVDSVYDRPVDMLRLEVQRSGLSALPLMERATALGFQLLNRSNRREPRLSLRVTGLSGVSKLYIQASDEPELAQSTRELFVRSPAPREQLILARDNYAGMVDEDKRDYENRVVGFFLLNLPSSTAPRR